jgi:beta-glucosidase/6-phospho-beta-glucosidase/beta-galactosidase
MRSAKSLVIVGISILTQPAAAEGPLPWIRVSADQGGFVQGEKNEPFVPWGFNYDHDEPGRLIEDYWNDQWRKVEEDFAEMKELGANVVRIHLQFGKFMQAADKPNVAALQKLADLVKLAEKTGL